MKIEIALCYYLQQHELTKYQLTIFTQLPNTAEPYQMTNQNLMDGSTRTSNKPLMLFKGTNLEYSVEEFLNAVTANLITNIGPKPI